MIRSGWSVLPDHRGFLRRPICFSFLSIFPTAIIRHLANNPQRTSSTSPSPSINSRGLLSPALSGPISSSIACSLLYLVISGHSRFRPLSPRFWFERPTSKCLKFRPPVCTLVTCLAMVSLPDLPTYWPCVTVLPRVLTVLGYPYCGLHSGGRTTFGSRMDT